MNFIKALLLYYLMVCLVAPAEICVEPFISKPLPGELDCPSQVWWGERHSQKCCVIGDSRGEGS